MVLIVCGSIFVALVALDVVLGRVKLRRADAKLESAVQRFRYKGW